MPARNECQSPKKATLDAARNKQTIDGVPNRSTAHGLTSNDDGSRTAASDEYTEGDHKVHLPGVHLEKASNSGDVVAYYKEND